MKYNINFTDLDAVVTFSNEQEDDWRGWEQGATFEDISVEMDLKDFCKLEADQLSGLQNWIRKNAEIRMRAACHERDERQRKYDEAREAEQLEARRMHGEDKRNKVKPGFVYLIASETGNYKIGKAKNVDNRVNDFGVKLPIKTWLVHSFASNNYDKAELSLHERYADKQTHGEWFLLSEEDVKEICAIGDGVL